jgi:hypothetical protein
MSMCMSILERVDNFIQKRLLHSSTDKDNVFVEPEETKHINNVIAAPRPLTHDDYEAYLRETNKDTKQ